MSIRTDQALKLQTKSTEVDIEDSGFDSNSDIEDSHLHKRALTTAVAVETVAAATVCSGEENEHSI